MENYFWSHHTNLKYTACGCEIYTSCPIFLPKLSDPKLKSEYQMKFLDKISNFVEFDQKKPEVCYEEI